ncbi:MaoC/PaaZ C-terminal domain-containing protein [Polyangium sp. 15x6]|uniref:MaoC/PaaZ C-terminal domain-containing protein n=1 Tax=Polyangium sp. 15x6 TaxID=3042687 RepID=UPI00249CA1EE|nr:MaoC/PaaZ C-terminal domain-containing protein [Polyangium sp. 15x6]MDI3282931.1 MaoC/PaaZ C-terminal domain-containing protein [Polyangium sp. 15x6]
MGVSTKHVLSQLPVLRGMGQAALAALVRRPASGIDPERGGWLEEEIPPRPADLVRDYVRHVGGDPAWYRGRLPAHMFPQWGFPLAARALAVLPYPLSRVVNAGCRIEQRAMLPANEPLRVRARIDRVDDDGHRALVTQVIETGTESAGMALVAEMRTFIPLEKREGKEKKARPTVPADAREIAFSRIPESAGLDFAKLTGDFNPIHWIAPYARAAGFRSCILHGFSTLARAIEALNRARLAGDPGRLSTIDVRFTRPLVLPARVGVYVDQNRGIWVGDAHGGGSYLEGHFDAEIRP